MFSGYLVKIKGIPGSQSASSDYTIPNDAIIFESYKGTYSTLDGSSNRNGNGRLKRKTYKHQVAHCSFTFRSMRNTELWDIWYYVKSRYVKKRQKRVKASVWVPELNTYIEDYFYVPDIEFTVKKIETVDGESVVKYAETPVEFIGY